MRLTGGVCDRRKLGDGFPAGGEAARGVAVVLTPVAARGETAALGETAGRAVVTVPAEGDIARGVGADRFAGGVGDAARGVETFPPATAGVARFPVGTLAALFAATARFGC